jgi:hypothetical protein
MSQIQHFATLYMLKSDRLLGGALAGAVGGLNRKAMVAALAGLFIGAVVDIVTHHPGAYFPKTVALVASPLGSLICRKFF